MLLWILFPHQPTLFFLIAAGLVSLEDRTERPAGLGTVRKTSPRDRRRKMGNSARQRTRREELAALYQAKGLTGKLLDEVVTVMMADDNRLLNIMLEEEMGLALEVYEHPLKQSLGAGVGVAIAAALFVGGYFFFSPLVGTALTIIIAAITVAKLERNRRLEALIWNLSLVAFVGGATYFLKQLFLSTTPP